MPLFGRASQSVVDSRWDDPKSGLTEAAFQSWPGKGKAKRGALIPRIEPLLAAGSVQLPIRLIGQCTTYDRKDGHPAHPQLRHDGTDFIVAGASTPVVVTFRKTVEIIDGFEPAETLMQAMEFYLDLQFLSAAGEPRGRIGFYTGHGQAEQARALALLVGTAIK